jgi:hypothetical protein
MMQTSFCVLDRPGGETDALAGIGYVRTPNHYYKHRRSAYTVEFTVGPLMIGSELVKAWETEQRFEEILHVLAPTDCVRDRFMAFHAWGDLSALNSALAVARAVGDRFDERGFNDWARREAMNNRAYDIRRLEIFQSRLQGS